MQTPLQSGKDGATVELPTPYRDAAPTYRAAGWVGVLPIPAGTKRLRKVGWTGHDGAWPSGADIYAWADSDDTAEGAGNIALRLPPGVIGIDVDNYAGKHGASTLAAAVASLGELPPTWSSTARSDGDSRIRLYRVPEGLRWPGQLGEHVEIIQTTHRYMLVWPSINPDTSTVYRWYEPSGLVTTQIPHPDELPDLPDAWIAGLTGGELAEDVAFADLSSDAAGAWIAGHGLGSPCGPMATVRDRLLHELAHGSAHESLRRLMGLVRLAEQGHPGLLQVIGEVHASFMRESTRAGRHGSARDPREAEGEWRRSLDGAMRRVLGQPSISADDSTPFGDPCALPYGAGLIAPLAVAGTSALSVAVAEPIGLPAPAQPAQHAEGDAGNAEEDPISLAELVRERMIAAEELKLDVRDEAARRRRAREILPPPPPVLLSEFLAIEDEPVRYRVDGLMPVGARVMLTAQFKAGKTTLVSNLLRALVDGEDFLGRAVEQPAGRIVLIDAELDEAMLRRWLRDQGIQHDDRIAVVSLRGRLSSFDVLGAPRRAEWAGVLAALEPAVVVLDCLRPVLDAVGLDEDKDAGRFLIAFDELLDSCGAREGVVVHHMGHEGERSRGSSRLRDWPDVEWRLVRQDEEPGSPRFFTAYGRDVDVPETELGFNSITRRLSPVGGSRKESKGREHVPAILDLLGEQDGLSQRQIANALVEVASRKELREALAVAIKDGSVWTSSGPRGALLHHRKRA